MATAEARLDASMAGVEPGHQVVRAGREELLADLRTAPELSAREEETVSEGTKGAGVELLVSLGASGTLASLARILHLWLSRDRRRSLTISVRNKDTTKTIHVDGDNVSLGSLTNALESAVKLDSTIQAAGDSEA